MANVRKHRDIKLVTTERRRNYLASGPNFRTTKFSTENLLAIEMRKCLIMYEIWYDYVKPKNGEKAKRFIVYIKTDHIYKYIVEDMETRFDT